MSKRKSQPPKRVSKAKSPAPPLPPEQEERVAPTFTEIGGSPVPGLTLRHVLRGHKSHINRIAWSPDGAYLASPSADETIRIWDASGTCVRILQGHTDWVVSVAWSPDGQRLASASDDQTICLWEPASGKHLQTLKGHTHFAKGVAWSPDGHYLASTSLDKT